MRLPYAPSLPPPSSSPSTISTYSAISARRHPRPLLPLDLALLHSPPVASGWNSFLGAIRTQTILPAALLELAICRIAVLNNAGFEWKGHCFLALKAGVGRGVLEGLKRVSVGGWEKEEGLSEVQRAVLGYTDAMTRDVIVGDGVVERLKDLLGGEREVVELTACVAAYNCVSRFLVALDVGEMNGVGVKEWVVGE